jgi:hypothetical protein
MSGQWFELLLALVVVLFPMLLAWAYLTFGTWRKRDQSAFRRGPQSRHGEHN